MTTASLINLSPEHLGLGRLASTSNLAGSLEAANKVLQKNHESHHIFFRDQGGHNHIAHSVLSVLALGGSPADLQRAYDDGVDIVKQRPLPPLALAVVEQLGDEAQFRARIGHLDQYTNFLAFFKHQIESKGWRDVVVEYLFSGTPIAETMLAQLYEGAYHPLIHLGLGIEFELPSIVAEGLAQAAVHDSANLEAFFLACEKEAKVGKPLVQLLAEVRADDKLRTAARLQDGPVRVRDGVLGRAFDEIVAVASQFRVQPDQLERGAAESINASAYMAGAAQRPGKARKIDFFYMHNVTSSIFLTVLLAQPWIGPEAKARFVERKGRLDLVWYAASAAPELRLEDAVGYEPGALSRGMGWEQIYEVVKGARDDGHVAKFVRALKNGEEVSRPFEKGEGSDAFPIKGDGWLRIAQMACDTALSVEDVDARWIRGCFDQNWARIPNM